jgi:glycosyltransferase involved in cell wall biosynthesis
MNTRRIIFYVATDWAVGSVHYELTKYLQAHDIDASVLSWDNDYSLQEMHELSNQIDLFVSLPRGIAELIDRYNIPAEKCVLIAHAVLDLEHFAIFSDENKARMHGYAVVSDWLAQQSQHQNIGRTPTIVPVGINYNKFYAPVSSELRTIGFAATYHEEGFKIDGREKEPAFKKRGYLVHKLAEKSGLNFTIAQTYHHSYVTMPGYYPTTDCIVVASTEEGAGLPALEAGAAGRLVITTPVGHYSRIGSKGAHIVPVDQEEFLTAAWALLLFYKNNPDAYQKKCQEIQEHARSYDWSCVIDKWIEVLK